MLITRGRGSAFIRRVTSLRRKSAGRALELQVEMPLTGTKSAKMNSGCDCKNCVATFEQAARSSITGLIASPKTRLAAKPR